MIMHDSNLTVLSTSGTAGAEEVVASSDSLESLLAERDFDRAVHLAARMGSQERIDVRLLPALDDACRRVACRQQLLAAVQSGAVEQIERAYAVELFIDYPAAAPLATQARNMLLFSRALASLEAAKTAEQWNEFARLWRENTLLLASHPRAKPHERLFQTLRAVERLLTLVNDPATDDGQVAHEFAALYHNGEPPRSEELRRAAELRNSRQAAFRKTREQMAICAGAPTYASDTELRRLWKSAHQLGETRLESYTAHYRAAKQRMRRLRCLNELTRSPSLLGEQHIAACQRYLPVEYHPKLAGRIAWARRRLDAVRALETMAHEPPSERVFHDAWLAVEKVHAQRLVTATCRERVTLAERRLAIIEAIQNHSKLPLNERDSRVLELWDDALLASCRDALELRPLWEEALRRRELLKQLETAIEAHDELRVESLLVAPELSGYRFPGWLDAALDAYRDRQRRARTTQREAILQSLANHDPQSFVELFDQELVAELCSQSPHHQRLVAAWTEVEILPLSRCGLARSAAGIERPLGDSPALNWAWPKPAISRRCILTISHEHPRRFAIPEDLQLLHSVVVDRDRCDATTPTIKLPTVAAWHGAEMLVWAVIDLGFQVFYSEPLSLGRLHLPAP
jgi:hypothetical protein